MSHGVPVRPPDEPAPQDRVLRQLLHDAALGIFPADDFSTTHLPSPSSPADAVLSFFGHHLIASDVDRDWVRQWTQRDPFALSDVRFLAAFADRFGMRPGIFDAVFAVIGEGSTPGDIGLVETSDRTHPRVIRALTYRDPETLRVFTDPDCQGVLILGRGLAGRLEAAYEVHPGNRGNGIGKALVVAARRLAPAGVPVFMQISPGNVWSMRAAAADPAWRVIGSEMLFHRSPAHGLVD